MIKLHRFNSDVLFINPDLIKYVEETPDTVLTFTDGKTLIVKECANEVCKKILEFRQKIEVSPEP